MDTILNFFRNIFDLILDLFNWMLEAFLDSGFFNKIVILNSIPAFLVIILPIAEYKIFDGYNTINNPLAVEMICIVILMVLTTFSNEKMFFLIRISTIGFGSLYIIYFFITLISSCGTIHNNSVQQTVSILNISLFILLLVAFLLIGMAAIKSNFLYISIRLSINLYYLIYILYLNLTNNINNSPFAVKEGYELSYDVTSIFYLSIGVAAFYLLFSLLNFFIEQDY